MQHFTVQRTYQVLCKMKDLYRELDKFDIPQLQPLPSSSVAMKENYRGEIKFSQSQLETPAKRGYCFSVPGSLLTCIETEIKLMF